MKPRILLRLSILTALACAGGGTTDLEAQDPLPPTPAGSYGYEELRPGRGLEISGVLGVLAPLTRLTEDPNSFDTEVSSSVATGGTVAYWLGSLGFGVNALFAPADLGILPRTAGNAAPTELGNADYVAVTGNVLYRVRLDGPASIIEPFFAGGAGIRDLSLDPIASPQAEGATDFAGTLAVGANTRVSSNLLIHMEIREIFSSFEDDADIDAKLQNDIFVQVGVAIRP